jgi:hypothetical protein
MEQPAGVAQLSLLGGPLHGLGRRLHLVRGAANTAPLGLVLGVGSWAVLVALALIQGVGHPIFALSSIAVHVRLLVVIPLLFACEKWVDPRMATFVNTLAQSGVVPREALPQLNHEIGRTVRWKDSWVPDVACLLAIVLWSLFGSQAALPGSTSAFRSSEPGAAISMAAGWYWFVCLPLFRFLILRWLVRLVLWWRFLHGLASRELHLVPTHPDGAAGLGYLEVTQTHFIPLALALSTLQAAAFAEEISSGTMPFEGIYPVIPVILVVMMVLCIGPAFIFLPRLWACRVKGLSDYMQFASRYVSGFDSKWVSGAAADEEPLLGTPDLQSLADLANSIAIVRNMRAVPVGRRLVRDVVIVVLLPLLPLLLLKYPIADLATKLFEKLLGM